MRLLFLKASLLVGTVLGSSSLVLKDYGYEGVVVAISPTVDEALAPQLINRIKNLINATSAVLFKATREKIFFRNVKILLPNTWNNTEYDEVAVNENFDDSDIRVDQSSLVYGHQPYTVQPGQCGHPGRYIHLTQEYLTEDVLGTVWGPRGKVLAHEWARLRWGVFDEVGYPSDEIIPLFYWSSKFANNISSTVLQPTYCANQELTGEFSFCNTNGLPNKFCRFSPDLKQNASSSLMSYQYLESVVEFCDSTTHQHNMEAPSRQNLMCNHRSIWDVILEHQDFVNTTNTTAVYASPNVTVVKQVEAKFCLVLDYSASMKNYKRINKLQRTVQSWLLYDVADGSSVAIVTFNKNATVLQNLTLISNNTVRKQLAALINTKPLNTWTSIGAGLNEALSQLVEHNNTAIVLVTDGKENEAPLIKDVIEEVVNSGVRVVTIAYGNQADRNLESLAFSTGGKAYTALDDDSGDMLDDAFQGALSYQPGQDLGNTRIKIYETEYSGPKRKVSDTFDVDSSVGRDLQLRLDANSLNHITASPLLVSPNGVNITGAIYDSSITMWTVNVPKAQVGRWSWSVELSGDERKVLRAEVTTKAIKPTLLPIYTRAWMNVGYETVDVSTTPVIIYAEVKQGNNPVRFAHVRAKVSPPDPNLLKVDVNLLDNGVGADAQAGDGIYSRYMTQYSTEGRYSVKVQAWSDDNLSAVSYGFELPSRSAPVNPLNTTSYCCGRSVPYNSLYATLTGNFSRIAAAGSFQVSNFSTPVDWMSPCRVTDLTANLASATHVTFMFTTPGNDYDNGMVSGYVIRMSSNRSALFEDAFDHGGNNSIILTFKESTNQTRLLKEAGTYVASSITLGDPLYMNVPYFLALRAYDDTNETSLVSNVGYMMLTTPNKPILDNGLGGGIITLLVIACIVFSVSIVLLGLGGYKAYKNHHINN